MAPQTITERVLLVDGPCRGWDLPFRGDHEIHVPNPANDGALHRWTAVEPAAPPLTYRVELWHTHKGMRIFLGALA